MVLRLDNPPIGASAGPPAKVTIADINAAPVVKFSPASIKLTERSQTTTTVTVGAGDKNDIPGDVSLIMTELRLMVSHPKMVITGGMCPADNDDGIIMAISGVGVSALSATGNDAGSFEVKVMAVLAAWVCGMVFR